MSTLSISWAQAPSVQITDAALRAKGVAIESCRLITAVNDEFDAEVAGTTLVEVAGLLKECEKARKQIKQPVLDLGRDIDSKADAFSSDLQKHSDRIRGLIGSYNARVEEAQRIAERKRQEELARIERERIAAEAEAKRKADEALKAAASPEQAETAVAAAEAEVKRVETHAAQQAALAPVVPRVATISGVSVAPVWKFEVVDVNELHKANPQFVTLTHKAREINAAISAGARNIPGLRIWEEKGVKVRS